MYRILAGVAALALVAACASAPEVTVAADGKPRASVANGVLVGSVDDGIASFKGVPFAAAPVGDLRWKAPQPAASWPGERAATEFGASCAQGARANAPNTSSEDCLYLNVYAPQDAKNAPVMVWIHGGSNINGSGARYDGAAFARDGIVTVTINYRMGAFGFFAHPEITKAAAKNEPLANYGLMDQTAALQWVQKNISAFGGDPKRVTVFGESAGAIDIYALQGLKTSKGLFAQTILESNITWGDSAPLAKEETAGKALAIKAGASETATLADLKAIPTAKFLEAGGGARFPIVDGRFMTETSLQAVARKHTVDVPIIVGTNSYEASLSRQLQGQAQTDYTDNLAGAPARFIANKSSDGKPSWLYFFSYVATERRTPDSPGAPHASEIAYVFNAANRPAQAGGAPGAPEGSANTGPSDEDKAMATLMHSCWVAFAKTGTPTCASGPAWPKYDAKTDQLMEFGAPSGVRTNFRKEALDKWQAEAKDAK
jgi:para-nitrobenzyl esterase